MLGVRVIRTSVSAAPPGLLDFVQPAYRCLTAPARAVAARWAALNAASHSCANFQSTPDQKPPIRSSAPGPARLG